MPGWRLKIVTILKTGSLLLLLAIAGCASPTHTFKTPPPLLGHEIPAVVEPDFQQISPAMVEFLDNHVIQDRGKEKAAWSLVWAVTDQNIREFNYDPFLTLSPLETFERRAGNCLSFSSMFMLMANYLGLKAHYQEVEVPQQWDSDNNTLLVSMHINVVVETGRGGNWIVDVSGRADSRSRLQRHISDNAVLAQYYNNLGADALTNEDLAGAYAYFIKAIQTEPDLHYLWSNLGVVYSRNEQLMDAKLAYLTALNINSSSTMATNNLYLIYEKTGDLAAAGELEKRVEKNRRKNPYYLAYLAAEALEEGRVADSKNLLLKAVDLNDHEYRFHYDLARTLVLEGDHEKALSSLQRALELAPRDFQVSVAQLDNLPDLNQQESN